MSKYIILGHENPDVDSVISGYLMEKLLKSKKIDAEFVIPDLEIEEDTVRICSKYGLAVNDFKKKIDFDDINQKYILVDHDQRAVAGEIYMVVDHHPVNAKENCKNYRNEFASSTSCLICQGNEDKFSKHDLELACLAAVVDTASFRSTKSRDKDKAWFLDICSKYGLDSKKLYKDGLLLTDLSNLNVASFSCLKRYNIAGGVIEASVIQIEKVGFYKSKIKKMIDIITERVICEGLIMFVFIVHDMDLFKTRVYCIEKDNITIKDYPEYTSRGTVIIPTIENELLKQKSLIK